MKKPFSLFLLSLFFSISNYAQDYEPIIKEGSFWDVYTTEGAGVCDFARRRYQVSTDTLINNRQYKKIELAYIQGDPDPSQPLCLSPPYFINSSDFEDLEIFLFEDITEKKVYIWYSPSGNLADYQEFVLYDFNVTQAGDEVQNSYYGAGSTITVSDVQIDSNGRKVVYFGSDYYYTEGIGANPGIIGINNIIGEYYTLYCWGNTANQNGCAPVLSIEDYQLSQIKIYPNPTSNKISLTNLDNNSFKLFSILGNEVSFQFSKENQEMDISHLKHGIYFLEIRGNNGSKRILKVVKN